MSILPNGWLPETAEAANALRAQQERDAAIDAQYADPNFVAQKKAQNLASSPYGPYNARYETDIALSAMWFNEIWPWEHNETWEIYIEPYESLEEFPGNPDVEDGPYSPFVNRFWRQLWLSDSDVAIIKEELFHNSNDPRKILENHKLPEWAERVVEWIEDIEKKASDNQANFDADFNTELKAFQSASGEYEWHSEEVYEVISTKYFRTWEASPESLDMAFEMWLNPYIKDITPDMREIEFQNLIDTVRDSDISFQQRFVAFTHILETIYTEHWAKWGRRSLDRLTMQKRESLKEAWLKEQFDELQAQLQKAKEEKNSQQVMLLNTQIEELLDTAEISSWDIFTASGDEIIWEWTGTTTETA